MPIDTPVPYRPARRRSPFIGPARKIFRELGAQDTEQRERGYRRHRRPVVSAPRTSSHHRVGPQKERRVAYAPADSANAEFILASGTASGVPSASCERVMPPTPTPSRPTASPSGGRDKMARSMYGYCAQPALSRAGRSATIPSMAVGQVAFLASPDGRLYALSPLWKLSMEVT